MRDVLVTTLTRILKEFIKLTDIISFNAIFTEPNISNMFLFQYIITKKVMIYFIC